MSSQDTAVSPPPNPRAEERSREDTVTRPCEDTVTRPWAVPQTKFAGHCSRASRLQNCVGCLCVALWPEGWDLPSLLPRGTWGGCGSLLPEPLPAKMAALGAFPAKLHLS